MEHMILAIKSKLSLEVSEEETETPALPISILFVLKKMDQQINPIMLNILGKLSQTPKISHYFTDQETFTLAKSAFPHLQTALYICQEHQNSISYVLTVGGDGTILYANKLFQKRITPEFISIEKGTLGFLCKFKLDQVDSICSGLVELATTTKRMECKAESRMRLTCQKLNENMVCDQRYECLNEVAITKLDEQRQLKLEIYISDELFTTTAGDGVLISTPTGSTAYALSAGGPILHNEVRTILIVPICPKSLSFRPICLPSYVNLKIKIASGCKVNAFVSCDGQSNYQMGKNEQIQISESVLDLISLTPIGEKNFNQWSMKLNNLLTWNADYGMNEIGLDRGDSRTIQERPERCKRV